MPFSAGGAKYPCDVCGRLISNAGFASDGHRRAHARRGESRHHDVMSADQAREKIERLGDSWAEFVARHGEWKGYDRKNVDGFIYR
jgi:hypothetical protein